ncbi:uncharacterized protein LOC110106475 isoform X2 [Dendrobium catenatum]|uniref:uncharacterized protein LOC110106475 isoform X2 n=1 Tax=Dendrobium catenatum TaxID=906689 RepID=UPI0010A02E2D|nr:uncharacterized protein LOC110106475 isoform X2 [Dendrobium catenatum]
MTSLQLLLHFPSLTSKRSFLRLRVAPPANSLSLKRRKIGFLSRNGCLSRSPLEISVFLGKGFDKDGIGKVIGRKENLFVVRAKQGFNSDDGGWDKSNSSRVLGNLVLAAGLTYLTVTGQLGWLLDALVSIWCPNCGNNFQIFKSSLKDGVQFCPYCTQPFSVQGDKFERESTRFSSNRSAAPEQVFNGSFSRSEQGTSTATIVDIEAEVKDIE